MPAIAAAEATAAPATAAADAAPPGSALPVPVCFVPCCAVPACALAFPTGFILIALPRIFTADHPMTSAATTMISQPGEMVASHTPNGDVTAPPRPAATPSDGTHVL